MPASVTKPKIVQDVAVYSVGPEVIPATVNGFLNNLERHRPILRGLNVKAIVFSMADIEKFDKDAFLQVVERFDVLQKELKVLTGVSGYTEKQFGVLKMMLKDTAVALFKNIPIATLAAGTSRVRKSSAILVYSEENDEKTMITSELISNGYFVIQANNFNDFKKKYQKKGSYSLIVAQSRFGGMRDDVMVLYNDGVYYYTVRGIIDETMYNRFDFEGHTKRLEKGFKTFVIDATKISTMDVKGAHFFLRLTEEAARYEAMICIVGLDSGKVYSNAMIVLEKCHLWAYDSLEDVAADDELIELAHKGLSSRGKDFKPTKETASKHPVFTSILMDTIKTYGKWELEKVNPSVQPLEKLLAKDVVVENFISFDGDIDGSLIFLFPRETAKVLSTAMTGVDSKDLLDDDLLDVMSEFVNSVTGKIKTSIVKKHVYISFSLPNSHLSSEGYLNKYKSLHGIVLEISLDGLPLYMIITGGRLL